NKCSRDNLLCYLALRKHDLSDLQLRLAEQGLSSLGMLEGEVLVSIEQVLKHFGIRPGNTSSLCKVNAKSASLLLGKRSKLIFGSPSKGRRTYIMVTLDSTDIYQHELIEQLLENGMDIVRINCAHNTDKEWNLIIKAIREAEERLVQRQKGTRSRCMILMDLGGPKIRTGPMELKVRPLKISVPKDKYGRAVRFVEGFLDSEASYTELVGQVTGLSPSTFVIAISTGDDRGLGGLQKDQKITFKDARDEHQRAITVLERTSPTRVRIGLEQTAYLKEGIKLECQTNSNSNKKCSFTVRAIKPQPIELKVEAGNVLRLYRDARLGHSGAGSGSESDSKPAAISCTYPQVLEQVKIGHRIFIDDGKIEAIVRSSNEQYLGLEIISPKGMIAKIKSNKGINFPDSSIKMPALTPDDIRNLRFVVEHADMVGLSFVHRPEDLYDLREILSKLGHQNLGIVAKIETADSIHNLAKILIAGLELPKFAILIARGDLAVEVGFENLAFVQEDILCVCEAAHIPVILATQILESLAESGLRSRAEMTDAIMGQRAECVMLNNGIHILEAVRTLAILLKTEERHQVKKHQLFREFTVQRAVFEEKN
ncbi:MAG: pyruvate kinase, partial [Thermoproteota archaeon]|nr:pyruvate kinase [Thermoproteota archaeon]